MFPKQDTRKSVHRVWINRETIKYLTRKKTINELFFQIRAGFSFSEANLVEINIFTLRKKWLNFLLIILNITDFQFYWSLWER